MKVLTRRLVRIARTGSPGGALRATRRELALRHDERRLEQALRDGAPLVAGPFLGEVGYELLYWRPLVLRRLRELGVDAERVTAFGRGGSAGWYRDVAAHALEAFSLMSVDEVRVRSAQRPLGTTKQLTVDALDRDLLARAGVGEGAAVLHPRLMYWRQRLLWESVRDPGDATKLGDYDNLPRVDLPAEVEERLPPRYVAVKAYFNDCVADNESTRAELGALVRDIGRDLPVVLLGLPATPDVHVDWSGDAGAAVEIADLLDPTTNLAVQAEVVARADALVSTYGGFAYLGPFLGVPTVAFSERSEDNRVHEHVLRAARPDASFVRVRLDAGEVRRELAA